MKILFVTNHSYMFWQFRREIVSELSKKHEILISTPFVGQEDALRELGCRVIETNIERRGINPVTDIGLAFKYFKLIRSERPDLIVTYSIKPNIYAGVVAQICGIPYCANVQGLGTAFQKKWLSVFVTLMYKFALKKARTTFFENEINAKEFRDRRIQTDKQQTILNGAGVNLGRFSYEPYPTNKKFRFLYLGRIMKEKGIDELFYAIEKLKNDNKDFVLDFVGFYEDAYEDKINLLVKEGIVEFHGFQEDTQKFYSYADCVVLASYHEGMSNVLLEASAIGRPIITTDIPGCREAINNDENGILVAPKDGEALYSAMKSMIELPREQREKMGKCGRAFMEVKFDKKSVVDKTIKSFFTV